MDEVELQPYDVAEVEAVSDERDALRARLDTIERRAQQIRGGLKPYARPPEVVDFLLAEPEGS